jgi:hypothetical protein
MDLQTWKAPDGSWKGQYSTDIVRGSTREEVMQKLLDILDQKFPENQYDPCIKCDVVYHPLCGRCLGS